MLTNTVTEFEELALPHHATLYRSARALLRSDAEADDVVQETFLQAYKSFHRFAPGTNCRAWLFSILFNVVRHYRRKYVFRIRLFGEDNVFEQTLPAPVPVEQEFTDPRILAALNTIPQNYSEVVLLCDVQEFSYREIAETLQVPIGTVMSRLSRGRGLLREKLAAEANEIGIGQGKGKAKGASGFGVQRNSLMAEMA